MSQRVHPVTTHVLSLPLVPVVPFHGHLLLSPQQTQPLSSLKLTLPCPASHSHGHKGPVMLGTLSPSFSRASVLTACGAPLDGPSFSPNQSGQMSSPTVQNGQPFPGAHLRCSSSVTQAPTPCQAQEGCNLCPWESGRRKVVGSPEWQRPRAKTCLGKGSNGFIHLGCRGGPGPGKGQGGTGANREEMDIRNQSRACDAR